MSVLPILLIVSLLCLFVSPLSPDLLLSFLLGSVLIIVGMGIFTLGAETSMTPIGSRIGSALTQTKKLPLILLVSFLLAIGWNTLEDHTEGFRGGDLFVQWRAILGPFFAEPPQVEHWEVFE